MEIDKEKEPFGQLPDEVLEAILDKISESKDFTHCSRVHKAFARILEPTKTTWLFHEVLPFVVDYLPRNSLLVCRQICSQWKCAIDEFLEQLPYVSPDNALASRKALINWYFWPSTSTMITDFLENMRFHPRNPFVLRRLRLGKDYEAVEDIDELADYWSCVQQLLAQFGSHVWCCKFSFEETSVSLIYILRGCLGRLQNLKSLDVSYVDRGSCFGGSFRRYNDLVQSLQTTPFPALSHLEHLSVLNVPCIFFELVFSVYASSVKTFEYCRAQLTHTAYYPGQNYGALPEMKKLESMYLFINREYFLMFPPSAPTISKLTISCPQITNGVTLGEILNTCKETLKELTISLHFIEESSPPLGNSFSNSLSVVMPRLEALMIANPHLEWVKTFLENGCCPNIETFLLKWSTEHLSTTGEIKPFEEPFSVPKHTLECSQVNSKWDQIHEFVASTVYNQALWEKLNKLKACRLSVFCKSSMENLLNTVITRSSVMEA